MISDSEFISWTCFGCEYSTVTNRYIPIFYCWKKRQYVKKRRNTCKYRIDGHPSNWQQYKIDKK